MSNTKAVTKIITSPFHWVIVSEKGNANLWTLKRTRKEAIETFLNGSMLTWGEASKKYGNRVIKVNVELSEVGV